MAGEIVTSCPLCLALSDPGDMIDFEIDRVVPRGRASVSLCRLCGSAAVRAMAKAGEPLAKEMVKLDKEGVEQAAVSNEKSVDDPNDPPLPVTDAPRTVPYQVNPEEPDDGKSAA